MLNLIFLSCPLDPANRIECNTIAIHVARVITRVPARITVIAIVNATNGNVTGGSSEVVLTIVIVMVIRKDIEDVTVKSHVLVTDRMNTKDRVIVVESATKSVGVTGNLVIEREMGIEIKEETLTRQMKIQKTFIINTAKRTPG